MIIYIFDENGKYFSQQCCCFLNLKMLDVRKESELIIMRKKINIYIYIFFFMIFINLVYKRITILCYFIHFRVMAMKEIFMEMIEYLYLTFITVVYIQMMKLQNRQSNAVSNLKITLQIGNT